MIDYKDKISQAKKIIESIDKLNKQIKGYQFKIVKIAIELCTIRHGGISRKIYTLKDFANDIEMHPKTLQNWVAAYRNVIPHIDRVLEENDEEWGAIRKTNRVTDSDSDSSYINDTFDSYLDGEKPFVGEFRNCMTSAVNLSHLLKKRDLKLVDNSDWIRLMEVIDRNSDTINDYLSRNK